MITSGFEYTSANEGRTNKAFLDTRAKPPKYTVGLGCTGVDPFCSPDPNIGPDTIWTDAQIDQEFQRRYENAVDAAAADLGSIFDTLDAVRQAVLADIAYQDGGGNVLKGIGGLAGYHRMLAAIRIGDWQTASAECIDSLNEVQTPKRCNRNASMLLSGQWPAPW